MKTEEIATHLRALSVILHDQGRPEACVITGNAADALEAQAREIESTRRALEEAFPTDDGFTEAFDALVWVGLLVPVPSSEAHRAEWGEDEETMWVWRWHPLATPSTPEETSR